MSEFRTFSGKTVDEAMEEACRQFGVAREKLEIEIMSGGSSGIFGLVGKKKAQVRARVREEVNLREDMAAVAPKPAASRPERQPRPTQPASAKAEPRPAAPAPEPVTEPAPEPAPEPVQAVAPAAPVSSDVAEADFPDVDALADDDEVDEAPGHPAQAREGRSREERPAAPQIPPQPLTAELEALVREVMDRMLDGILGQIPDYEISGNTDRVTVLIRDEENSGLLIGREGQTLASIQYLVNRMVIRRHGDPIKVQINTGEYRERQDDNLRKMAIFLADKAKSLGRPQSTKPLSSYHRRVVHLALQEDEGISTRSKGDGPLKRVLIVPRAARGEPQNGQRS
jgi:spoIIIJ-associated protein